MPKRVCACFPNPGTGGVELLTTCMNSYFTRVIACIDEYDGDVVKFAGGWKKGSSTWPTRCKLLRFVLCLETWCDLRMIRGRPADGWFRTAGGIPSLAVQTACLFWPALPLTVVSSIMVNR